MDQRYSLVLDGTFGRTRWLTAAIAAGTSRHFATLVVDCRCPDGRALNRIADRLHAGPTMSEATSEVLGVDSDNSNRCHPDYCSTLTRPQLARTPGGRYRHLCGMLPADRLKPSFPRPINERAETVQTPNRLEQC